MDEASSSLEEIEETLKLLEEGGVRTIDTARIYGSSEELLGKTKASSRFSIDTKYPGGFSPEPSSKVTVIATGEESLRKLQTTQVRCWCSLSKPTDVLELLTKALKF